MCRITDEFLRKMIGKAKHYCVFILRHGRNWNKAGKEESSGRVAEET